MRYSALVSRALLGLSSIVLGNISTHAATVPDPALGDLYVGFRVSGGIGGSTSYLVKVGQDTALPTTLGSTIKLSLGNLGLDLAATYGAEWYTRQDLTWGVFGHRTSASPIVYASKERLAPAELGTAWPELSLAARNSVDSQISSVLNSIGGYRGSTATANSAVGTFQTNSSNASSYAFQVGTEGTTDFGSLSQWGSIEGNFGDGAEGTVLDLYRVAGSGVTYRGSFSIEQDGSITFSVVPEPTVTTLLVAAGVALAGFRRRRTARPIGA